MNVYVDESPVGVGKTYRAINKMVARPSKYLFITERIDSINEIEGRVRETAGVMRQLGAIVCPIRSTTEKSVRQRIEDLPNEFRDYRHVIVLATHNAMMMSDLRGFDGWEIIIDEVPNILSTQKIQSKLDVDFFRRNFQLENINGDWSKVSLTDEGERIDGGDLMQDDSHRHLRLFHQRVKDNRLPVICDLQRWEDMSHDNVEWNWFSLFSIDELRAFDSIQFLANGFTNSIAHKLLSNWTPEINWIVSSDHGSRKLAQKKVNIHYFSERRSSLFYFGTDVGQSNLRKIGEEIARRVPAGAFIWSANNPATREATPFAALSPSLNGTYLTPRQAGTSKFMHIHHAAMFYAAKPSSTTLAVIDAIGCTEDDWVGTHEHETILQFLSRTSVRDVESSEEAFLYVFDAEQADYLHHFFDSQPHITAETHFIDLHLAQPARGPGRPRLQRTPAEAAAMEVADKARRAAAARARRARKKAEREARS